MCWMSNDEIFLFTLLDSSVSHDVAKRDVPTDDLKVVGFRIEHADKEPGIEDGVPVLRSGSTVVLRLFGFGFSNDTKIGLTPERLKFGSPCNMMINTGLFKIVRESETNAKVEVILPKNTEELFMCATNDISVRNL